MFQVCGERVLRRSREELWALLLDPAVLARCIPRCQSLELLAPHRYHVKIQVRMGFVRASLEGEALVSDIVHHERYLVRVDARGRTGSVEGTTSVRLEPREGGAETLVAFESHAKVHGPFAGLGVQWLRHSAEHLVDRFFEELDRQ